MTEANSGQPYQPAEVEVTRHPINPIRAAIFEATFGDMETALAIARGDVVVTEETGENNNG